MSFIPKAKIWMPVRRNPQIIDFGSPNGNELWETRRLIAQRLQPGDELVLWGDLEDDYDQIGGPQWPVKNVFWNADGIMCVEMALMILDPSEEVRAEYSARVRGGWDSEMFNSVRLWPGPEDSFDTDMERGGWRR